MAEGEVNWIIETKGRVWEGTAEKAAAMSHWCERVSESTGVLWRFAQVNQADFDRARPQTFAAATQSDAVKLF